MLHITKIKPLNNSVLVTGNKYEKDVIQNGIIVASKGDLKTNQEVVDVGPIVRDIKPGDKIVFNPMNYAQMKIDPNSIKKDFDGQDKIVRWHLPWVTIEDSTGEPQDYLMLSDRDIMYVYEGYEKEDSIIVPPKKKVLLN